MSNNAISNPSAPLWQPLLRLVLVIGLLQVFPVKAGEEWSADDIKREITYLAKKLLDMSGKDSVTVDSPAFVKPFIGVCSEITPQGVKLTCVTPGTEAVKAGLLTGDIVVKMKGMSLVHEDEKKTKEIFYGIVESMKTGERIELELLRDSELKKTMVNIGSVNHPAFVLKVNR